MYYIVGCVFENGGKVYNFDANSFKFNLNDKVIVETERGVQFAFVSILPRLIPDDKLIFPLKKVIRKANANDIDKFKRNSSDAFESVNIARGIASDLGLKMRIIDASYNFDRSQLLFRFLSDERVDFRELAKKLAQLYKTRIELRQIGVRDKAREIGGIGPCGRLLCCSTFLSDFNSVSINMAKNQFISLNPTKINGVCGRLLCCLKYEDSMYTELRNSLPNVGTNIEIKGFKGRILNIDIFKQIITLESRERIVKMFTFEEYKDGSN